MCKEPVTASGCFFPHRKMPVLQCSHVPHNAPQCPTVPHPQMLDCCHLNIFLVVILKFKALSSSLIVTTYVMSSMEFFGNQQDTQRGKWSKQIQLHKLLFRESVLYSESCNKEYTYRS